VRSLILRVNVVQRTKLPEVTDTIAAIRLKIIQAALDMVYREIDSRLDKDHPTCNLHSNSIAGRQFCDSVTLGALCQATLQKGEEGPAIPRSAEKVSGSVNKFVLGLFNSVSRMEDLQCRVNGKSFRHRCCLQQTAGMFKNGEVWLSRKLWELRDRFPTQDQKDYMAGQREKCGFKAQFALPYSGWN